MTQFEIGMIALQWAGFACLVMGTAYLASRRRLGALLTIGGCISLGAWALLLTPTAWGAFAVQFTVGLFSVRNYIKWGNERAQS